MALAQASRAERQLAFALEAGGVVVITADGAADRLGADVALAAAALRQRVRLGAGDALVAQRQLAVGAARPLVEAAGAAKRSGAASAHAARNASAQVALTVGAKLAPLAVIALAYVAARARHESVALGALIADATPARRAPKPRGGALALGASGAQAMAL